jgi:hypothetical protein
MLDGLRGHIYYEQHRNSRQEQEMSDVNMELWDAVQKTDPSATKAATVSGQKITSINGQYMIRRATETFGPAGIGWGWNVVEERFDKGGDVRKDTGEVIGSEVGHTVRIRLWFERDGKRGEVEQYGCTPFTYKSKWGVTTDTEAPKKSLTDAIKKALAMLGFSADIFTGMFDDADYVRQRESEEQIERAEDKEAEAERQRQERLTWLKTAIDEMEASPTMHALKSLHTKFVRDANRRGETAFVTRLARTYEEVSGKLEQKQ